MITRIRNIIAREKIRHPNKNGIFLLTNRLSEVLKSRIKNGIILIRKDSTFNSTEDMFMCGLFPKEAIDVVLKKFEPKSVLDVGCGQGISLKYFIQNNLDAIGVENSKMAISLSDVSHNIVQYNLKKELNLKRKFDLVWCFEVIEHIHPKYEANFLKTLVNHSSVIILSAARPGQGGHGHFNEQEPEYWIEKFSRLGFYYEDEFSARLQNIDDVHCKNLLCFRSKL